jgi:FixJ family two-component response regulator
MGFSGKATWGHFSVHFANRQQLMNVSNASVFVIDDDASVRESLASLIRSIGLNVRTFTSAQEFLRAERLDQPSCLVLDVRLPETSGLDFQRELAAADIRIPIIFITGYPDVPAAVRAIKAGAVEFLTKPVREQELLDGIQLALKRDRDRRREEAEIAILRECLQSLTPREQQILPLLVSGLLNKQIAAEIGTSEAAVKVHRGHLMRKMGAKSIAELVRMAEKLGIPSQAA